MTPVLFVIAAVAGAMGRLVLMSIACTWQALLAANVAGSAMLGGLLAADLSPATITVLGVGLCGALTTFSSFALEVRALGRRWSVAFGAIMVVCACGAASIAASVVAT